MTPNRDPQDADLSDGGPGATGSGEPVESDVLVEDVSIDGMCGVY
jgi:mycofactocin precursor